MLKENLSKVESDIRMACKKCGRDRSEITLIAHRHHQSVFFCLNINLFRQPVSVHGVNQAYFINDRF